MGYRSNNQNEEIAEFSVTLTPTEKTAKDGTKYVKWSGSFYDPDTNRKYYCKVNTSADGMPNIKEVKNGRNAGRDAFYINGKVYEGNSNKKRNSFR